MAATRLDAVVPKHPGVNPGHPGEAHPIHLKVAIGTLAADLTSSPDGFIGAGQGEFEAHNPLRLLDTPGRTLDSIK